MRSIPYNAGRPLGVLRGEFADFHLMALSHDHLLFVKKFARYYFSSTNAVIVYLRLGVEKRPYDSTE